MVTQVNPKDTITTAIATDGNQAKDISKLSDNFLNFVSLYVQGVPIYDAWVQAGYAEGQKFRAKSKLRENWKTVEKLIDERISDHVPEAITQLVFLMRSAKSDTIKLKAAQDLLSRAGKDKPIQIRNLTEEPQELTDEVLDHEVLELLKQLKLRE